MLEYLAVVLHSREVHWFALREGLFHDLMPDRAGVIRSVVFPGLWLDTRALLGEDLAKVLATLDRGLRSPEHKTFVRSLARKARAGAGKRRKRPRRP